MNFLIKGFFYYLLIAFLYPMSFLRWKDIFCMKQYLYNCRELNNQDFILRRSLIAVYDIRLGRKGSWIGYSSTFKDTPCFPHGIYGIFVSGGAIVGTNCVIYQQVTVGSNTLKGNSHFGSPTIGDNVLIGAGAKIIGKVTVGNNVRIGANAVVVRDVPDNCVVVGNGRIIQKEEKLDNRFYHMQNGNWGYFDKGLFVVDNDLMT